MNIALPDPLQWSSGLEFGIQAIGELARRDVRARFRLSGQGPLLEGATFAVVQYGLLPQVEWVPAPTFRALPTELLLLPRVVDGDAAAVLQHLQDGGWVVSTDRTLAASSPRLLRAERRDVPAMVAHLLTVARSLPDAVSPAAASR